ncbi:MAG: phosphoglucosamine mutase, partial [Halobacteriaceae archaeon]
MEVFGSSGTRGVANDAITPSFACRVSQAVATEWEASRVAIAKDTRTTGDMLTNAAASGLESCGKDVDRLGILPTPGLQAYAEQENVPAVMITASHNPPEYNGIKLIGADGVELSLDQLGEVEETLLSDKYSTADWMQTGTDRTVDVGEEIYINQLVDATNKSAISDANLTVALDPGHGAGALTSPDFFRKLGCQVLTVNAHPDGHFPGRNPEPIAENLDDLGRLVRT